METNRVINIEQDHKTGDMTLNFSNGDVATIRYNDSVLVGRSYKWSWRYEDGADWPLASDAGLGTLKEATAAAIEYGEQYEASWEVEV